jgi:hypothetical protein
MHGGIEAPKFVDGHLPVEKIDAMHPELRRLLDDPLDRQFLSLKVPVGVSGQGELQRIARRSVGGNRSRCAGFALLGAQNRSANAGSNP